MQLETLFGDNKLVKILICAAIILLIVLILNNSGNIVKSIFNCGHKLGKAIGDIVFK